MCGPFVSFAVGMNAWRDDHISAVPLDASDVYAVHQVVVSDRDPVDRAIDDVLAVSRGDLGDCYGEMVYSLKLRPALSAFFISINDDQSAMFAG